MATYGITKYGAVAPDGLYAGVTNEPNFRVEPFTCASSDYKTILVTWTKPLGTIFAYRLIRNRYGYPADQNDGQILVDSLTYPGSQFRDTSVVPGQYHYYSFFVQVNQGSDTWVKAGVTACLAIQDFGQNQWLLDRLPAYFTNTAANGAEDELTADPTGNLFLLSFLKVIAFGLNYLKTQYNTYTQVNNAWLIPLSDLYNLSKELGLVINPDISAYTLRKAIFYNAVINEQRGTVSGIAQEISALTGWNSDLRVAQNMMLENDQSAFLDPAYPAWSANIAYTPTTEFVTFNGFVYQCVATGNRGNAPTGAATNNTWWNVIQNVANTTALANATTGFLNTWEPLTPGNVNGTQPAGAIKEFIGVVDPLNGASNIKNALGLVNTNGTTQTMWLRSIDRSTTQNFALANFAADPAQAIGDGIPIPNFENLPQFVLTQRYNPGQYVQFENMPFVTLKSSIGLQPPFFGFGGLPNEWAQLSTSSPRPRICISAYVQGSSAVAVVPFIEWYDIHGNFISRVFARSTTPGTAAQPNALAYEGFLNGYGFGSGSPLNNQFIADSPTFQWTQQTGIYAKMTGSPGFVYPQVYDQRSIATVNAGVSDTNIGITFVTNPAPGQSQGLALRYASNTSYIRADMQFLKLNNNGVITTLGTYNTAALPGDRLTVNLLGSTITCFVNGVQVLQVTSTFNQTATLFGIITETT